MKSENKNTRMSVVKYEDRNNNFYNKTTQLVALIFVCCCLSTQVGASKKYTSLDAISKNIGERKQKPDLLLFPVTQWKRNTNTKISWSSFSLKAFPALTRR